MFSRGQTRRDPIAPACASPAHDIDAQRDVKVRYSATGA